MNKSAIRNFAVNARKKLIDDVKQKAYQLGITESEVKEPEVYQDGFRINQQFYKKYEIKQREKLLNQIEEKGFEHVMEEVAYTWFNRFIAIRFMEVNDYLPTGVRLFSSIIEGKTEPDAVSEVDMIAHDLELDMDLVYQLQDANDTEGLFKYILVKQCNKLGEIMPVVFERIADYTELLLPDQLLSEGSVIRDMVELIEESDWKKEVEIIGWLYQYYISEENERVIKAKKRYKSHELPYATQLFTPNWIVRYMVQNSLGRYWIESHPEHRTLISNWEFYLENSDQWEVNQEKLASYLNKDLKVEDIKCFDPAMGSGHILVYMFDVLYEIYRECGYMEREIPRLIIENNLYGLDIDDRAYQLATFSVIMKAMKYNRHFLQSIEQEGLTLNIASIQETNQLTEDEIIFLAGESSGEDFEKMYSFLKQFHHAKVIGALIKIQSFDEEFLTKRVHALKEEPETLFNFDMKERLIPLLESLIKQAKIMSRQYDIFVTNPPYAGNRYVPNETLKNISKHYPEVKSDLFSSFVEYSFNATKQDGQIGFMTPYVWMFISSYEKLRKNIIDNRTISSLIQLEYSGFDGATVPICTFTLRNYSCEVEGEYIRLSDFKGSKNQPIKTLEAVKNPKVYYRYTFAQENFKKVPGNPIIYWASNRVINIFSKNNKINDNVDTKVGLQTGNNERFLRLWYEININKIGFNCINTQMAIKSMKKWFPYNKGGSYRKWYGNQEYVVNWENDGYEIKHFFDNRGKLRSRPQNIDYYFKQSITWSFVSSAYFGVRYSPKGFIFDVGGSSLFPEDKDIYFLTGLLTSKLAYFFLMNLNPTLNFQVGNVGSIPLPDQDHDYRMTIEEIVTESISISKKDWDSFETSWDFKHHPFINGEPTIKQAYEKWEREAEERFQTLKANEEELNRIFIDIYGLQDELTPEVEDKDVTVRKADLERDVKSFISYAVGCMLGRYSLDEEGLIYAGGEFDPSKYTSFPADEDNVIPITDEDYFDDDIVARFVEFVRTVYGEESLEDNLEFIAEALSKRDNETARQRIRRYFLNEFYTDHVRIYQKRPIYWQFDSGRQNGFKALVYMHRYDSNLVARVRTEYLHMLQRKYESEMQRLNGVIDSDVSKTEKRAATKQKEKLQKQLSECREYDQVIAHIANQRIEIDLDDGVKVNYAKFQNIEVPQGEGKAPLKNNLLKKI
ncbi:BREX-1 system adenine-specific DNA-methyltransferase PglX [Pueribacillus sp. YX66]|uniref:BREX-1 system adenine-specific DNA-methyltransferase PglX n=1 Tax=Pueribacillus sp. YX66 TaxID=3229242 RepID=UPI00358D726C